MTHLPHFSSRSLVALFLFFLALFCSCRPTLEDEARTLLATDARFARTSLERGTAEAFYLFMAPDGMQLRPGTDPIVGPQAIKDHMSAAKNVILSWSPRVAEVSGSRDLGYTWGTYTVERASPAGAIRLGSGKYLTVWKKQPNGQWKVFIDIGNEDPEPTPERTDP